MANLVDIFTQSNSTNVETSFLATSEDLPKDKPSLFDSLLKNSIESLEANKQPKIEKTLLNQNNQEAVLNSQVENLKLDEELIKSLKTTKIAEENSNTKDSKNSSSDEKTTKETAKSSNSLLDRLLIEARNSNLAENVKSNENIQVENVEVKEEVNIQDIAKTLAEENSNAKDSKNSSNNEETTKETAKSSNSLLDRLLIEVKNSNLAESVKSNENIQTENVEVKDNTIASNIIVDNKKEDENTNVKDSEKILIDEDKILITKDIKNELDKNLQEQQKNKIENQEVVVEVSKDTTYNQTLDSTKVIENIQTVVINSDNNDILTVQNSTVKTDIVDNKPKVEDINSTLNVLANKVLDDETNQQSSNMSLMDRLIQANSKQSVQTVFPQQTTTLNIDSLDLPVSKDIASNIFLAEQKNLLNNQMLFNKNEALKILEQGSTLEDIQKSATILDLDATNLEVEQDLTKDSLKDVKLQDKEILERKNILNSLLNEKNVRSVDIRNLITNSIEASKALLDNTLTIKEDTIVEVQTNLANSIQSRIIGAKQNLSSMMSDIARQMYENYKPPVTVFKINLNPAQLGAISILMKQDRSTGLNINMSVTSLATLELLMENQNLLRSSLSKTFNEATSFNLDFSSGEDKSNSSNSNSSNQENKDKTNTEAVLKLKESNQNLEEQPTEYM